MLFDLIINFCILFTFAVLSYWPFQDQARFQLPFPKFHPYFIGIMAGFTGFILMETSVSISDTIMVDSRHVLIVMSGLLGGPVAPIISGIIIGFSRMVMDGVSFVSFIAGLNSLLVGVVVGGLSYKYKMNFKNVPYYFFYSVIQSAIVLSFLLYVENLNFLQVFLFILFSLFSFTILLVTLIELKNHFEQIRKIELLSETDYLTGLYNNRKFHQLTKEYLTDSSTPFSMILVDIDHFKKVNHRHGHPVGDEILKELGTRLHNLVSTREGFVARNGGEQFAILLPNAPPAIGLSIGEKIRSMVARSSFSIAEDQEVSFTVSIGVSSYPDNGSTVQEIYSAADAAMYEAKAIGRNRVFHYTNKKA